MLRSTLVNLPYRVCTLSRASFATTVPCITLPEIDVAPFLHDGSRVHELCHELLSAASSTGFLVVQGHGIKEELMQDTFRHAREFFARPLEEKMAVHVSKSDGFRGYSAMFEQGGYDIDKSDVRLGQEGAADSAGSSSDAKEAFHVGPNYYEAGHPFYDPLLWGPNRWPGGTDSAFGKTVQAYYTEVLNLSNKLFRLFAHALDLPQDHFAGLTDRGMDSMNLIHYPPASLLGPSPSRGGTDEGCNPAGAGPDQMGIGAHTDFECFTLLAQEHGGASGLEVLDPVSGVWQSVPSPGSGAFVLNVGDMLARWSCDVLRSTVHRATNPATDHRYAIAFFRCCNYDVQLEPLVPLERRVREYEPIGAGEHMLQRIGAANEVTLGGTSSAPLHER